MKILKRTLQILLILIVSILIAGFFFIRNISRRALPDYNADISLKGLASDVEVFRDHYGIPHVYAETERDLYTAVGYLMAQDRLWQMDLLRRVTLGQLSEIFGEGYVETDLLLRALRYSVKSKKLLQVTEPEIIDALEAFANGVNQYIAAHQRKLPPEFAVLGYKPEPWEPFHSLNLIGYMAWDLKAGWSELLLEKIENVTDSAHMIEIIPDVSVYKTFVYPGISSDTTSLSVVSDLMELTGKLDNLGVEIFRGSNNWAVSGKKSTTGKPLLANDMHLSLSVPGIWYQMHQVVRGKLNVTGLVLPGQPLVICGHNEQIAWGMTNTYVDNMDFYLEKINPSDSHQYMYMDEWKDFNIVQEQIAVKGGDTVVKDIRFSHRGPVISGFKKFEKETVTMHWVGDEFSNEMRTVYLLNRAGNWHEFNEALKTFRSISQNIVYADSEGNIGLFCAAGIPIRKRTEAFGILPGWTDEYNWQGMVPFEGLPYSYNPPGGFVSSANNKTTDENYPYHIGNWYDVPYRIERIRELLTEKDKLSADDFMRIQLDQQSKMAVHFLPELLEALRNRPEVSQLQKQCMNLIEKWDGKMSKDSPEAAIFEIFYLRLSKNLFSDELGIAVFNQLNNVSSIIRPALYRILERNRSVWADDVATEKKETLADIYVRSFQDAVEELQQRFGDNPSEWEWGNLHRITLQHPLSSVRILDRIFSLNRGPYRVGGSFHTVSPYSYGKNDPKEVNHGASHRHIFTFENWDGSLTVIPTGNSGIPASRHYCDQTKMYIGGDYHKDLFSRKAVESDAVYHMNFRVAEEQ
ncbi:MAG: penicillin acylase family protein [Bacteroidales bacterium]|nr:penicillin acylase family protein [Bacteroidales bacterium]